jgi:hypothetical protein
MFRVANHLEAGLWAVIGLLFLLGALRRRQGVRRMAVFAGVVFLAFGASDVVEVRTGAWWRPWWLLVWKTACVLAMFGLLVRYYVSQRTARVESVEPESDACSQRE